MCFHGRLSPSYSAFAAADSPSRRVRVLCTVEAEEPMVLIEPSYSDLTMIFRASGPSSMPEVELRVFGVHLAQPTF